MYENLGHFKQGWGRSFPKISAHFSMHIVRCSSQSSFATWISVFWICHKLFLYFVFATNYVCILYFSTGFVCILFLQQTLFVSCFCNKLCCILYFQETLFVFCFSSSNNDSRSRASQFRSHSLTFSKLKWCFAKFFQRDVGHRNILIESKHLLKPN